MMKRRLGAVLAVLLCAGCGSNALHPGPGQRAVTPGLTVAHCGPGSLHHMGECLPRPPPTGQHKPTLLFGLTIAGPDLSNNDPIVGQANWNAIAKGATFAVFKVSEGTGYTDRYARVQAQAARSAGLVVGGYDFAHVCDNPDAEAALFAADYKAAGLGGQKAFHPWLDIEYKTGSCDARAWLEKLIGDVRARLGVQPGIYTGQWFWNPTFGNWWPSNDIAAWVSGYGVRYPFMPGSRRQLDMWQYTDRHPLLGGAVDWSTWMTGAKAYASYTRGPKPPPSPAQIALWRKKRDASLKVWNGRKCSAHLARHDCYNVFGHRVTYFQGRIWTAYRRFHCFGPHAQPKTAVCQVVRPEVSRWSHGRTAAQRSLKAHGCRQPYRRPVCRTQGQRESYFNRKIKTYLY